MKEACLSQMVAGFVHDMRKFKRDLILWMVGIAIAQTIIEVAILY